jgi:hypothetical protein
MAYSDFTNFSQLRESFGIKWKLYTQLDFIPFTPLEPSEQLRKQIEDSRNLPIFLSEKARSEFLISPILLEIWRKHRAHITLFSGVSLEVDKSVGLNGICDYLINMSPNSYEVETPVICLVEAKNRDLIDGLSQCGAEMYAATILNKRENQSVEVIYGCVTDGEVWIFLKLENNIIYTHTQHYFLNEIEKILGILDWIILQYTKST